MNFYLVNRILKVTYATFLATFNLIGAILNFCKLALTDSIPRMVAIAIAISLQTAVYTPSASQESVLVDTATLDLNFLLLSKLSGYPSINLSFYGLY